MKSVSKKTSKKSLGLNQPEYRHLIRKLRHLMQLTQVQLAAELGVTYETINRWENGRIQPSPLALKQIRVVLERIAQSPSSQFRDEGCILLNTYFLSEQQK
ncbi:helix-turn-helix domain-containing protein [Leptolyngbya sp. PL-A3]|uniref:helix-turn-helix domain-containing protein n=1 Tax=Leptolyngbya sp. PL-A3 TaxID=2933911 RepID=UPI0032996A26